MTTAPNFRWQQLEYVSRHLVSSNSSEAFARSAVNRAYYAAFGEAKEFAIRHGYVKKGTGGGSHQQVWSFLAKGTTGLSTHELAAWKAIAAQGVKLKAQRVNADYFGYLQITLAEASLAITEAQGIIRRLSGLR